MQSPAAVADVMAARSGRVQAVRRSRIGARMPGLSTNRRRPPLMPDCHLPGFRPALHCTQ